MKTTNKLTILTALLGLGYFSVQAQESVSLPDLNLDSYALQVPDLNADMDMSDMLAQRGGTRSGSSSSSGSNKGSRSSGSTHSSASSGGRSSGGSSGRNSSSKQTASDTRGGGSVQKSSNSSSSRNTSNHSETRNRPSTSKTDNRRDDRPQGDPGRRPGGYDGYDDPMPPPPPPDEPVYTYSTSTVASYEPDEMPKQMLWVFMGLNLSQADVNNPDYYNIHFKTKAGFAAGIRYDVKFPLFNGSYFSFGANYSKMNFRTVYPDDQYSQYDATMIEFPIYYGVRADLENDCYLGAGFGPVFSLGLGGEYKSVINDWYDVTDEDGNVMTDEDGNPYQEYDVVRTKGDTYGKGARKNFSCGLGGELWANFGRVFVGYSLTLNFSKDRLCEYYGSNYDHDCGFVNNCIKVGYRLK